MQSHDFLSGLEIPWLFEQSSCEALENVVSHQNTWTHSYILDVTRQPSCHMSGTDDKFDFFMNGVSGLVVNFMLHVMQQDMVAYLIDFGEPAHVMSEHRNNRKSLVYLSSPVRDTNSSAEQDFIFSPSHFRNKKANNNEKKRIGLIAAYVSTEALLLLDRFSDNTYDRWSDSIEICLFGGRRDRCYDAIIDKFSRGRNLTERIFHFEDKSFFVCVIN